MTLSPDAAPSNHTTPGAQPLVDAQHLHAEPDIAHRYAQARRFLERIAPGESMHLFVTFDDSEQKRGALVSSVRGTLDGEWKRLDALNARGAGVFVLINQADGDRATDQAVRAVRAVFADHDPPKTAPCPASLPLQPTLQVATSPGRTHTYWKAEDVPVNEFRDLQRGIIAQLNSDPAPKNPGRVMRLPGFYHCKDPAQPFPVEIIAEKDIAYDVETLSRVFARPQQPAPGQQRPASAPGDVIYEQLIAGVNLHETALQVVGRLVHQGLEDAAILAMFEAIAPRLIEVRGEARVRELLGGELKRMILGARGKGFADAHQQADCDYLAPVPQAQEAMFYGLIGEIAQAGSEGREVNPIAVAQVTLSWLSAQLGGELYVPIGDTDHPLLLFTLHLGRTARGAKGDATALVKKLQRALMQQHLCGLFHSTGLSTREGLAYLLRDGDESGNDPGVEDKRLWVLESEFANILTVGRREGNPLSEALRELWDGMSLGPLTKTSRTIASNPHVALHGSITPEEFKARLREGDISNGFANRFLLSFSERPQLVPEPPSTDPALVAYFADQLASVIRWAKGGYPRQTQARAMRLSPGASELWRHMYPGLVQPQAHEQATALLARQAPIVRRTAAVYAATDQSLVVDIPHLEAALAWAAHHRDTVAFVFGGDAQQREEQIKHHEQRERLLSVLRQAHPEAMTRTRINQIGFGNHIDKNALTALLGSLLVDQLIERQEIAAAGAVKRNIAQYRWRQRS